MMRICTLLLAAAAGLPGSRALAEAPSLPSFVLLRGEMTGPRFDLPAVPRFVPHLPRRPAAASAEPDALRARIRGAPAAGTARAASDDEDEEDDEPGSTVPGAPGRLPTSFVKYPVAVPNLRNRSLGPHLRPDVEFDLNDRASLGVITQVDALRPSTIGTALGRIPALATGARSVAPASGSAAPGHAARGRDLGLGASFEIKLGP